MRILFIGGTRFVGKAMAEEAIARGHQVTVFHRGNTELTGVEAVHGDRESSLSALAGGSWDATVDVCAYRPGHVESLHAALGDSIGRYCFISTVSVYSDTIPSDSNESALLTDTDAVRADPAGIPMSAQSYGPLKVLCERAALTSQPAALIIRPTYVIGPDDHTMRFPTWVERIAAGGMVECPGPASNPMQYIDARDQARFVVDQLERDATGTFHCAAPPITFGAMLEGIASALQSDAQLVWRNPDDLVGREAEFPLWSGSEATTMLQMNPAAALNAGLHIRPFAETVQDTAAWLRQRAAQQV